MEQLWVVFGSWLRAKQRERYVLLIRSSSNPISSITVLRGRTMILPFSFVLWAYHSRQIICRVTHIEISQTVGMKSKRHLILQVGDDL